jgi:hypothetical protein
MIPYFGGVKMLNKTSTWVGYLLGSLMIISAILALALTIWLFISGCGEKVAGPEIQANMALVEGRVLTFMSEDVARERPILVPGVKIFVSDRFDSVVAVSDKYGRYSFLLEVTVPRDITLYPLKDGYTKRLHRDKFWGYYGPATVGVWPGEKSTADLIIDPISWGLD